MKLLKQSTARNLVILMIDSADHITGKASLTLTITASKDGAAFASVTPTVTDLGSGFYSLALTTTHTNTLGDFALHITSTGADPSDVITQVVLDLPGASVASVTGAVGSVTGAVGSVTGAVGSVTGAVGSVTAGVTVTTNNDKTGYTASTVSDKTGYALTAAYDLAKTAAQTGDIMKVSSGTGANQISLSSGLVGLQDAFSHITHSGTAQAGAASSITLTASASATDNIFNGQIIKIYSATGIRQARVVTAYNGTTKVATVDRAWQTNPDSTSVYALFVADAPTVDSNLAVTAGTVSDKTGYTASTVSDKTGYALTSAYDPAKTASQAGDVMKLSTGTGANQISLASGLVTVGTNNDKTGYTASTVSDKTGYSLAAGQISVKKNTALANFMFMMYDSADHITPKTGLTVTCQRSIDGAAFANCATSTATEVANGWYKVNLANTDLNGDVIALKFTSTGADATNAEIITQA